MSPKIIVLFLSSRKFDNYYFPHGFLNLPGSPVKIIIYHDNLTREQLSCSPLLYLYTLLHGAAVLQHITVALHITVWTKIDSYICQLLLTNYAWATLDSSTVPVGISQDGYC
jgi:hypothetical protein